MKKLRFEQFSHSADKFTGGELQDTFKMDDCTKLWFSFPTFDSGNMGAIKFGITFEVKLHETELFAVGS